jgi:hypothetical protein
VRAEKGERELGSEKRRCGCSGGGAHLLLGGEQRQGGVAEVVTVGVKGF